MKLNEELLLEMEVSDKDFSDGILKPDGDYILIEQGHLHTLMGLLPYTENEIWDMIPKDDSPLFWLIEHTGCIITDYNSTVGMKMTPAQETAFRCLIRHSIITDKYFDITNERKKAREKMHER